MILSEEQLRAVRHMDGPALCIAGPGSGKTAVIVNRADNLIKNGVKPEEILVVTFAKAAAKSMEQRFFSMTGTAGVRFSTIHSLCYHIINNGKGTAMSLIREKTKRGLIKKILDMRKNESISLSDRQYNDISMEISRFKSLADVSQDEGSEKNCMKEYETHFVNSKEEFNYIYTKYSEFLNRNSYYDFDDMTGLALKKLITEKHRFRWRYLLADEFQDTSRPQLMLLSRVVDNANIFAVGDDDQSIYSFRGASPAILKSFRDIYPDCSIFFLKDNYRCNEKITKAANMLIKENKERFSKEIVSRYETLVPDSGIFIKSYKTGYEELAALRDQLMPENTDPEKTYAVLTRTNHEAQLVCCMLDRAGISYNSALKNQDPFDNPFVNVILSFIRLSMGQADLSDFVNVMKVQDNPVPARVVTACFSESPEITIRKLKDYAVYDEAILSMLKRLESRLELMREMSPDMQIMFIRKTCGADMYFRQMCHLRSIPYEAIEDQADVFAEYVKDFSTSESLIKYERERTVRCLSERGQKNICEGKGVNILTLHASKGLEFDRVWIINVNEGIIPFKKAADKGMIEEERRLFYVGMTRAKDRLTISSHKSVGSKKSRESSFLKNLIFFR